MNLSNITIREYLLLEKTYPFVKVERNLLQNVFSMTAIETARVMKLISISALRQDNTTAKMWRKRKSFTLAKHLGDTGPKTKKTDTFNAELVEKSVIKHSTSHPRVSTQAWAF